MNMQLNLYKIYPKYRTTNEPLTNPTFVTATDFSSAEYIFNQKHSKEGELCIQSIILFGQDIVNIPNYEEMYRLIKEGRTIKECMYNLLGFLNES